MSLVRNVVILTDYGFYKGGAEKVALTSAVGLAEKGLSVHLFSAVGPVVPELQSVLGGVHCLDQHDILSDPHRLRAMTKGIWNFSAEKTLARLLCSFSPRDTVVHSHQWTKALTASVFKAVHDASFEFVITFHDYFISCPNGGFLVFSKNEICEREPLSLDCIVCDCDARNMRHKSWRVVRQSVQDKIFKLPHVLKHCIFVSEFSRRVLAPHLPPHLIWHYVPNPVDFCQLKAVDVIKNNNFLFVGRLAPEKGALIFAQAARKAGVNAVFVGDGEQREAVLRANPNAAITGWADRAEVLRRYRTARALVFPSLWYETQGLSVAEALSLGVPAIVTDRCAASDAVIDGQNGYRFLRGSVDDLADKLSRLQNDEVASRLSAEAYRRAQNQKNTIEDHVDRLVEVYEHVLGAALLDRI